MKLLASDLPNELQQSNRLCRFCISTVQYYIILFKSDEFSVARIVIANYNCIQMVCRTNSQLLLLSLLTILVFE